MISNWYKLSAPFRNDEHIDDIVKRTTTYQRLNEEMPEDIDLTGYKALGNGCFAVVFEDVNDPSRVRKFTLYSSEGKAVEDIIKWQKKNGGFHPLVVGIYSMEVKMGEVVIDVVAEKVDSLSNLEKSLWDRVHAFHFDFEDEYEMEQVIKYHSNYEFMNEIEDFINKCRDSNFYVGDLHSDNVGWRKNSDGSRSLVILDLGWLTESGV